VLPVPCPLPFRASYFPSASIRCSIFTDGLGLRPAPRGTGNP
jgi:hypothetical protein